MLKAKSLTLVSMLLVTVSVSASREPNYPAPAPPADGSQFGAKIQRTMMLLATSTPERRNPVKILFYGQSITKQKWSEQVADYIRKKFPYADLTIENRAIGGFASQLLIRTAEFDLYPFYPDLLVFHVYGDHRRYEDIIRLTRERTTTEIAIYNDHSGAKQDKTPDFNDGNWTAFMDKHIRKVAKKYNCELIDIHEPWKQYLRSNHLKAADLLRDGIHLNDHGNFLLAQFVQRHFLYKPQSPPDPCKMVTTYQIGKDVSFVNGRLTLEFNGNRIDAVSACTGGDSPAADVFIDGKKPSQFPSAYAFTRPSTVLDTWPAIIHIGSQKPLIIERWTAKVHDAENYAARFKFDVFGSKTGYDGSGTSEEKFISNSGRIVIEPNDWHLNRTCKFKREQLPENFETTWRVVGMFTDRYIPLKIEDPSREYAATLIQGISNSKHTLELKTTTGRAVPIKAIRVYRPPFNRQ